MPRLIGCCFAAVAKAMLITTVKAGQAGKLAEAKQSAQTNKEKIGKQLCAD